MLKKVLILVLFSIFFCGLYGSFKSLPSGLSFRGTAHPLSSGDVEFFSDRTYVDDAGSRHSDQQIFDEAFRMIDGARSYILIDMFLFNDFMGTATTSHRALSSLLIEALITQKNHHPNIEIQVITDPINSVYGGYRPPMFDELTQNGISLITTDLSPLRDSNPTWSALWRSMFQFLPDDFLAGTVPNLFDTQKPKISVTAFLASLNFKANHRKVLVADYDHSGTVGLSTLITSANPHDGSSAHSNIAFRIDSNPFAEEVIASEQAVAQLSRASFVDPPSSLQGLPSGSKSPHSVTLLTEGAIKIEVLSVVQNLKEGDSLDIAMFYFSDRNIVRALKAADERGVTIRLLLDPNKDAFGREKNGIPNRMIAHELIKHTKGNTEVRWCDTHGEQCHTKLLIAQHENTLTIVAGSANFTRRNLDDLNIEMDLMLKGDISLSAAFHASLFFNEMWDNEFNKHHSTDYTTYAEKSLGKTIWYRIGEITGMSHY